MPKAQRATAAGESAETTETHTGDRKSETGKENNHEEDAGRENASSEEKTAKQPQQFGTRLGAVLSQVEGLPADLQESEIAAAEEGAETAAPTDEAEVEVADGAAEVQRTEETKSGEEEEDKKPLPNEWTPEARAQVMEERKKRKKRTEELTNERTAHEQTKGKLTEAEAKIAQLSAETPVQAAPASEADPLGDVQSPQALEKAVSDYEELQEFCAQYPNGVEGVDVATGKVLKDYTEEDVQSGKVRNYSAKDIATMNLKTARILQKAVPVKRQYFQERMQYDPIARRIYPEVFDQNGRLSPAARELLAYMPGVMKFSDGLLVIGRYLRGMKAEQELIAEQLKKQNSANGNGASNGKPVNEKIAPLLKKQPPMSSSAPVNRTGAAPTSRSGGDVDLEQAEQAVIDSGGDDDAIEKLVALELENRPNKGRVPATV